MPKQHGLHGCPPASRRWTLFFLYAVCLIEGADIQLLPATFRALEVSLGLTPSHLAALSLCQALMQALSAPCWGSLADHGWSRKWLLTCGALSWGTLTLLLAIISSFPAMIFLRGFNGIALGMLVPVTQSVIVDITTKEERGLYFGGVQFAMCIGAIFASVFATSISQETIRGMDGWRVAFAVVGFASLALACILAAAMTEPGTGCRRPSTEPLTIGSEVRKFRGFCRIDTFKLIVLQGVFGSVPWSALAFLIMYFQYVGLPDWYAAMLFTVLVLATGVGGLLGGFIGDRMCQLSANHGRPLTAQISVASGIPLVAVLLAWIPPRPESASQFATVMFLLGLFASWCGTGVKRPILAEVVGVHGGASSILALDTAIEGASAAVLGAPLVGLLADVVFGYEPSRSHIAGMDPVQRETNTIALAHSMLLCSVFPWLMCFVFFSLLHFTYGPDVSAVSGTPDSKEERPDATSTTALI